MITSYFEFRIFDIFHLRKKNRLYYWFICELCELSKNNEQQFWNFLYTRKTFSIQILRHFINLFSSTDLKIFLYTYFSYFSIIHIESLSENYAVSKKWKILIFQFDIHNRIIRNQFHFKCDLNYIITLQSIMDQWISYEQKNWNWQIHWYITVNLMTSREC